MKCNNILEAVGHTPLIRLNRINQGLALVAAVRGYKCVFTTTDKQSKEKVDLLKALGAEVIVCPTAVEPEDPRSYYSVAKKLAREIPNSYYPNQYDNPMNPDAHYRTTGPEIWEDSEGKITHFVCGMGTGGTISGVGKYQKEKNPNIQIIGVDPYGSLYYDFVKRGETVKAKTYVVEGIGEDFFPGTMNLKIVDDVIQVNDEECFVVARRLVKLEGLFTGGSGGGCISAALQIAKNLGKEAFIVAFLPDTGMRYLSKVYNDEWMRERGYVEAAVKITAGEVVSKPLPQVPRTAPVERITYILSHENPAVFVAMGDTRFEILTKYDLMSTVASLMESKR